MYVILKLQLLILVSIMGKLFGLVIGILATCAAYDTVGKIYNNIHEVNVKNAGSQELAQPTTFISESFMTVGYVFISVITVCGAVILLIIIGGAIITGVSVFF
jgi:hypothetical protein